MKIKRNYKVWGLTALIIIAIGIAVFFILPGGRSQNEGLDSPEVQLPAAEQPADTNPQQGNEPEVEQPTDSAEQNQLMLFTGDIDTYQKKEAGSIAISSELKLEQKLEAVAEELSKTYFDELPIEIAGIEEEAGKKIAIINLKEHQSGQSSAKTWMNYINAGSAGSIVTLITLEESFLQRELQEEWVDGIKIIHEGADIEEMDHFPGTAVIYR